MASYLFLMDPPEKIKAEKDTSYACMLGAQRRGHRVFYLPRGGVSLRDSEVVFDVTPLEVTPGQPQPLRLAAPARLGIDEVDLVFIRSDPPFDERYLLDTWLLDAAAERCVVVNAPSGLRSVNEKLWPTRFPELVPPTLVSSRRDLFDAFLEQHGEIVAKPTNGFGGSGVFRLRRGDTNAGVIWETLTGSGRRELIAQAFLREAEKGDKRILLLGGEAIGAVLRVHAPSDHRNNFFAGGTPHAAEITAEDRRIIDALRPELVRLGLHLVGIDVIGGRLIEVNVTSPTCLQEMNRLYAARLEDQVVAYLDDLVDAKRGSWRR